MAKIDELHNYAYPDKYLDELHIYDKSKGVSDFDEVHNYGNRGVTYGMDELHLYGSYQTEEIAQDEVNKPTERELIDIDEYFDEIEALDEEQKEERKNLAEEFKDILQLLFALILADLRVGNEINEGFYLSLGKSRCMGAVDRLMPHLTIEVYTQIENYIHQNLTYVIESTVRNQADAYYFSEERATAIAVDDAMASANLEELELAKKNGVKFKIWTAFKDDKVRKTHKEVDGKKVAIDKPFKVGRCLMQAPMIFDEKSVFQDAKEVINCRCTLTWSNNKNDKNRDSSPKDKGVDNSAKNDTIKSENRLPMDLQFFAEKDLKNQGIIQLEKGIRSLKAKISEHEAKISNPSKFIGDWDKLSKEYQNSLLNHWNKEIKSFNKGIDDRNNELKARAKKDE